MAETLKPQKICRGHDPGSPPQKNKTKNPVCLVKVSPCIRDDKTLTCSVKLQQGLLWKACSPCRRRLRNQYQIKVSLFLFFSSFRSRKQTAGAWRLMYQRVMSCICAVKIWWSLISMCNNKEAWFISAWARLQWLVISTWPCVISLFLVVFLSRSVISPWGLKQKIFSRSFMSPLLTPVNDFKILTTVALIPDGFFSVRLLPFIAAQTTRTLFVCSTIPKVAQTTAEIRYTAQEDTNLSVWASDLKKK